MERNLPFFVIFFFIQITVSQNSVLSQVDNADDDPEYFPDSASQASMDDFTVFSFARFPYCPQLLYFAARAPICA